MKLRVLTVLSLLSFFSRGSEVDVYKAIAEHDIKLISGLTNNCSAFDVRNSKGRTPLMEAARCGDVEIVKMLLSAGVDKEAKEAGFTVKDQVESYLRRTGEEKNRIIEYYKREGYGQRLIQMVENEAKALGETPERIASWKEILKVLKQEKSDCQPKGPIDSSTDPAKNELLKDAHVKAKSLISAMNSSNTAVVNSMFKDKKAAEWVLKAMGLRSNVSLVRVRQNKSSVHVDFSVMVGEKPVTEHLKYTAEGFHADEK